MRLACRAHAGRRPDVAVGLLRGRHGDRRWRQGAARLRVFRRASVFWRAHRGRAGDQHVARLQRLRRTEPVHRRHPRRHATADGGGLPVQTAGQRPSRDGDGRAGSAERRARRLHPAQPPVGLCRVGGLARLGVAIHRVGRTRSIRDRCVHERRSRSSPRGVGRRELVSVGRPRRVLVSRDARHGRGIHSARRQCGVLLGQHVVVAGAHRG